MSSAEQLPVPARTNPAVGEDEWWRTAVFYQVYPRSFADANGDGEGDLVGLRLNLDHLVRLGIDALWLSPFYRSPMADGGYDVSDPCDVDPRFGTLADFDALLTESHERGIRVTIDIVPNHFSDQHIWFREALTSGRGSPERARFIFRDGRGPNGALPPNNWESVFGGPAWQQVSDGQWFLHLFAPEQPDLDWSNPAVPAEFERILRFWLDRGVDGFRIDVAHGMAKPVGLPDMDLELARDREQGGVMPDERDPRWDQDALHDYLRMFRRVLDSYPGERMAVGEAWVANDERLARYVRPEELNLTFNFLLAKADWSADSFEAAIDRSLAAMSDVGAPCTWVLSNHDIPRHVTRYGGGALGERRGRAAALIQLALPGAAYLYNGDELALPNVDDLPEDALQDPTWERTGHTDRGRDGERVPLPWSGDQPPYGFSTNPRTWLPMPAGWADRTVAAQAADPDSTLGLYAVALRTRRLLGDLRFGEFTWIGAPEGSLAFRRGDYVVATNFTNQPAMLPLGEVILSSAPIDGDELPPNCTVWLRA